MKLLCPIVAVTAAICLNALCVSTEPDSPAAYSLLSFISYAPYIAFLVSSSRDSNAMVLILSAFMFASIGLSIAWHYKLGLGYGIGIGCVQGVLVPALLFVMYRGDRGMLWVVLGVATWTSTDYLIAQGYGIAVTLPIQLYRFPLLLQPISVLGAPALDALLMASNGLLGLALARIGSGKTKILHPLILWVSVILTWLLWSSYLWNELESSEAAFIKVSTISPGRRFNGDPSDLIRMTRDSVDSGARFVVWPEVYIRPPTIEMSCLDYVKMSVSPELSGVDAYVVVGCEETVEGECNSGNIAITLGPDGEVLGFYGKQHPVTMIGERSCLRNGYQKYPINSNSFINGDFHGLSFSTLICYDMDFEDSSSIVADMGASLILNPSEDWSAARGHFAASVFRAVENRVAVAKADWGWDSAIIQPSGEVSAMYDSPEIHRQTLLAAVPIYAQKSTTNRMRINLFAWACMILATMILIAKRFDRSNRSSPQILSDFESPLL